MKTSLQLAVAFALSIARIQALPSTSPEPVVGDIESGMRITQIDHKDEGTFIAYEAESPSADLVSRQSCSGSLTCNGEAGYDHLAPKDTCHLLIDSLQGYPVAESPRSYCLNQNNGRCCVSWAKVPPSGTVLSQFKSAAYNLEAVCGNNADNTVSGKDRAAVVNGACVPVCLSSRPDGC